MNELIAAARAVIAAYDDGEIDKLVWSSLGENEWVEYTPEVNRWHESLEALKKVLAAVDKEKGRAE